MALRLQDERGEGAEPFLPAAAPVVRALFGAESFRERAFARAAKGALRYLGFAVSESGWPDVDLYIGQAAPPKDSRCRWLRPRPESFPVSEAAAKGFAADDLAFFALKTHYRRVLELFWPGLQAARDELERLRHAARSLERGASGASAPNQTGLAGYKKRFRDALSGDLDFPGAVAAVEDALRPGALSPGSRLACLRDAESALGIELFEK